MLDQHKVTQFNLKTYPQIRVISVREKLNALFDLGSRYKYRKKKIVIPFVFISHTFSLNFLVPNFIVMKEEGLYFHQDKKSTSGLHQDKGIVVEAPSREAFVSTGGFGEDREDLNVEGTKIKQYWFIF